MIFFFELEAYSLGMKQGNKYEKCLNKIWKIWER